MIMSSKLVKFAESSNIMNLRIKYRKEIFEFNLDEELRIQENNLDSHLKGHVRSYAFLSMLHVKLKMKHRDIQKEVQRLKQKYLSQYKGEFKTVTQAEAVMYANKPDLKEKEDEVLRTEELRDLTEVCVKAFEQRKDLLQTLAANIRKEK